MKMFLLPIVVLLSSGLLAVVVADVMVYDRAEALIAEFTDLPSRFGPMFPMDGE